MRISDAFYCDTWKFWVIGESVDAYKNTISDVIKYYEIYEWFQAVPIVTNLTILLCEIDGFNGFS